MNAEGDENDVVKIARLHLPLLRRNRINHDVSGGVETTTCYKYLLCTQILLLLMEETEKDIRNQENANQRRTRSASRGSRRASAREGLERVLRGAYLVRLPTLRRSERLIAQRARRQRRP
jgi:hypothetical protein